MQWVGGLPTDFQDLRTAHLGKRTIVTADFAIAETLGISAFVYVRQAFRWHVVTLVAFSLFAPIATYKILGTLAPSYGGSILGSYLILAAFGLLLMSTRGISKSDRRLLEPDGRAILLSVAALGVGWATYALVTRMPDTTRKQAAQSTQVVRYRPDPLVLDIQKELTRLNYYHGAINGHAGPQTREAIKGFQKDRGVAQDGKPGKALLDSLKAETAPGSPTVPKTP